VPTGEKLAFVEDLDSVAGAVNSKSATKKRRFSVPLVDDPMLLSN